MGCLFSCSSSSSSTALEQQQQPDRVRVVHLNGYFEDFVPPVAPSYVMVGKAPNHFLCSSAQLLRMGAPNLLQFRAEDPLVPGRVYFLLPLSLFDSPESSPTDLASIAKRLTAAAKRAGPADAVAVGTALQKYSKIAMEEGNSSGCRSTSGSWKPVLETIMEMSMRREALSFRSTRDGEGDGDSSDYLLPEPLLLAC